MGCDVVAHKNIFIFNSPSISFHPNDTTLCKGATIQLFADADVDSIPIYKVSGCGATTFTYQSHLYSVIWSTGDTGHVISITPVSDKAIYVYAHQPEGTCPGVDSVTVTVNPAPLSDFFFK